jgi:hypothetical protein
MKEAVEQLPASSTGSLPERRLSSRVLVKPLHTNPADLSQKLVGFSQNGQESAIPTFSIGPPTK